MKFDRQKSAGYLANYMARLFARGLNERLAPLGISVGQWAVLTHLWETDGISQKDLVDRLNLEQATVANTLNRMERDDLIVRAKNPSDARGRQIWLTERANVVRDRAAKCAMDQNSKALADLSSEEQQQFLNYMGRVITSMQSP